MAEDVNNLRWKLGWSPWSVIIGTVIAFTIIGAAAGAVGWLFILGVFAGVGIWYWGVREINAKYQSHLQEFVSESARDAKRSIEVDSGAVYNLTYNSGSSPPLVDPADTYRNTAIVVTDTSINLNKEAQYDMKARQGVGGGTNEEIYYDQVTGVESHQDEAFTTLEIKMSGGRSTTISSIATDTVDEVVAEVRQRVREIKNPGSSRASRREDGNPERSTRDPSREQGRDRAQEERAAAEDDAPAPDRTADRTGRDDASADDTGDHPITETASAVAGRTRPTDSLADELCAVLAAPSPDEDRLESVLEETVERLERTGAVTEAIEHVDDPTADAELEAAQRTLAVRDGPLADGLEPILERALEAGDSTDADVRADEVAELERELAQSKRDRDRIRNASEAVCREADRSGTVTFRSEAVADRTAELADALERGDVVFETPSIDDGPDADDGAALPAIVDDVERSAQPQTAHSRELLEAVGDPDPDDEAVASVLESTVETLDEFADLRAAVADIGRNDVRRRLGSLDDELQRSEGPVYRHLADRVRELEATVDRDAVDDVQLYAIYQESTFYDRTLLPRLARSDRESGGGDSATDIAQLRSDVEARLEAIETDYVEVRADHNHTIPNHFRSLAADLCEEAQSLERDQPERAAGLLTAADDVLDRVEQLYERNEYSVMLRRLRG